MDRDEVNDRGNMLDKHGKRSYYKGEGMTL